MSRDNQADIEDDTLILDAVDRFIERHVEPYAHELEAADAYPVPSDFTPVVRAETIPWFGREPDSRIAMVTGMSVSDLSYKSIANLGWDKIRLTAPVFAGDTIYAESEILAVRESRSRPNQGIVTARTTGAKSDGTVIITYERSFLVPKRGHAVDDLED